MGNSAGGVDLPAHSAGRAPRWPDALRLRHYDDAAPTLRCIGWGLIRRLASPVECHSGCPSRRSTTVRCPTRNTDSSPRSGLSITSAGLRRWSSGASAPGMTTKSRQQDSSRWCCALGEWLEAIVLLGMACAYSGPWAKMESRTLMTRLICSSRFASQTESSFSLRRQAAHFACPTSP